MLYQYHCQRRRGGFNPHGIGTLSIGQILYLQDFRPMGGIAGGGRPVCRNPWIVESFANREYFPAVKGSPAVKYLAGGHLVNVRSLRTGERRQVADWIAILTVDADLEWIGWRGRRKQKHGLPRVSGAAGKSRKAA